MRWRDVRPGDAFSPPRDGAVDLELAAPYLVVAAGEHPTRRGMVLVRVLLPTGRVDEWVGEGDRQWFGDARVGSLQLVAPR